MQQIGTQIRKLRKERKLTLQQLAGDRLTKGMLSLIENGKAQPSMESLHYIAKQLNVHISVLMQNETANEAAARLQQLEEAIESYRYLPTEEAREELRIRETVSLASFIEASQFTTFEEVEIYYYYASYYTFALSEEKEQLLRDVMQHYSRFHAHSHVVRCYLRIMEMYFAEQCYAEGLATLEEAEQYIDTHTAHVDVMRKIDVYYYTVVLASALGKQDITAHYTDKVLTLCKENRLYYETSELYRIRFSESLTTDAEQARYFLMKMEQFATFTEDITEQSFYELTRISYTITVDKDYDQALAYIDAFTYSDVPVYREIFEHSLQGLRGLVYYLRGQYETALSHLQSYTVSTSTPYPLDICSDYRKIAVRGMCRIQLGQINEGKADVYEAYERVMPYADNYYKREIISMYEVIQTM